MKEKTSSNRGGRREGAGRKRLYQNPATISFVVEKDLKDEVFEKYKSKDLRLKFTDWLKELLK